MAKIFVARSILNNGIKILEDAGHEVVVSEKNGDLTKSELIKELQKTNYDAVITLLTNKIDEEVLSASRSVKIFANYAVGYDNIDIEKAKEKKIFISNTPNVLTESVAEHAVAMIMSLASRLKEADIFTVKGKYKGWDPKLFLGVELCAKTIGILGAGRIGTRVAEILINAFDMKCIYYDKFKNEKLDSMGAVQYESPNDLISESDVISIHMPLSPATHHFFNLNRLSKTKHGAILINTSRGPVIKESDLVQLLDEGRLSGVGLDVFEDEPEINKKLKKFDRVLLTPHIASASKEARGNMSILCAENILEVLSGKTPKNQIV